MKLARVVFLILLMSLFWYSGEVFAQGYVVESSTSANNSIEASGAADVPEFFPEDNYYKAEVLAVIREGKDEVGGYSTEFQILQMKILEGKNAGKMVEVNNRHLAGQADVQKAKRGDLLVVVESKVGDESVYMIADRYRLTPVFILIGVFLILAVIFGRWKGFFSIFGLGLSILIIVNFMVPKLAKGENPLYVVLSTIFLIAVASLYLAHGFSKRTTVALVSTMLTLGISIFLAQWAVNLTELTGIGSEEAFYLQLGPMGMLNLRGLLLGGILIGTLGVLDDITTNARQLMR